MKQLDINFETLTALYNQGLSCQKIADQLNCSEAYVSKSLRAEGITKRTNRDYRTKQLFNHHLFDAINTETSAYWLGALMADGCVMTKKSGQHVIALVVKDREWIQNFIESLDGNFHVKTYGDVYGVYLTSEHMFHSLGLQGCVPRKSLTLQFPTLPKEMISHFIRGYFDGDGSVIVSQAQNKNRTSTIYKTISICICGTYEFLKTLQSHIGGNLSKEKRRTSNTWKLTFSGTNKCRIFYQYLYTDATLYLSRKKNKFESYYKERGSTTIIDHPNKDEGIV